MTLNGISSEIAAVLAKKPAAPFLFLGSGFSRRYIGLETWAGLLERFSEGVKDFNYYLGSADGDLPKAANLLAKDYFEYWWKDERFEKSRVSHGRKMHKSSSPLKLEISKHLREQTDITPSDNHLREELALLTKLNVDGVITTNWDNLAEAIFPEYKVFVGQEELIFSNPQSIAEIYKIHGCCSKPESLVLTEEDYSAYEKKYSYLVAKLITIFIEHPVFFIGYSLADDNIQDMLGSIVGCLTEAQLEIFSQNLFFVKRAQEAGISRIYPSTLQFGNYALSLQVIETSDFSEVYAGIETVKRKIPARVLRVCKEQMYELVKSTTPDTKLAVANLDELDSGAEIEFVVGVGVAQEERNVSELAQQGYRGITPNELYMDVISDRYDYDPKQILDDCFPNMLSKSGTFFPGYKYLKGIGITSLSELNQTQYSEIRPFFCKYTESRFRTNSFARQYIRLMKGKTASEIIDEFPVEKAAAYLPYLEGVAFDLDVIQKFLLDNFDRIFDKNDSYHTYYKKLAVLYDRVKHGFHSSQPAN